MLFAGNSALFKSQNNGKTWVKCGTGLAKPNRKFNLQLFEKNDTLFAVTIDNYQYTNQWYQTDLINFFYSVDGGNNFYQMPDDLPKGEVLDQVYIAKSGDLIISNEKSFRAYIQKSPGFHFITSSVNDDLFKGSSFTIPAPSTAVIQSSGFSETKGALFVTRDDGQHWKSITTNLQNGGITSWKLSNDTLLVLSPFPRYTTDWGITWHAVNGTKDTFSSFDYLKEVNGIFYMIQSSGGTYWSKNLTDWQEIKVTGTTNGFIHADYMGSQYGIMTNGYAWSNNGGYTWNSCKTQIKGNGFYIHPLKDKTLISFSTNGSKYFTSASNDSGKTWRDTTLMPYQVKDVDANSQYLFCLTSQSIVILDKTTLDVKYTITFNMNIPNPISVRYHQNKLYVLGSPGGLYEWNIDFMTGINQYKKEAAAQYVYPNPATNRLTIELNNDQKKLTYQLFNVVGTPVMSGLINQNAVLDLTSIPAGLYFLRISGSDSEHIHKVLVSK